MPRHCFVLDLANDPDLIAQYVAHHRSVWPEILEAHRAAGILEIEIYLRDDRLFMIMEVDESFSFERKAGLDAGNEHVQAWETLMSRFQLPLPSARAGEKWLPMERIHHFAADERDC